MDQHVDFWRYLCLFHTNTYFNIFVLSSIKDTGYTYNIVTTTEIPVPTAISSEIILSIQDTHCIETFASRQRIMESIITFIILIN